MKSDKATKLLLGVAVILFITGTVFADGLNNNEVEFTGTISSVAENGDGTGTVFVNLQGFDLRVVVNSKTNLKNQSDSDIKMSDLAVDQKVEVTGRYSSGGILASLIRQVSEVDNSFDLRGHITSIQSSGSDWIVSLLGIQVHVSAGTKIDEDGATLSPSDLKVGMKVHITGTISGSTWAATSIGILSEGVDKNKVRFEGVVTGKSADSIQVAVHGLAADVTKVVLNSNTLISGDLAEGSYVFVIGYLNADLTTTATEIRVLQALEIKPDERKLKVGQTAVFTVKLRETAAADVTVTLSSSDQTVLALSAPSVIIPKGSSVADFSATARSKVGSAVVTAETSGQKATADVTVGEVSESENERPAGEIRISFAPRRIKLGLNESRDVVLLIQPPQAVPVNLDLKVTNGLVTVTGPNSLGSGVAELKITVEAGAKEGSDSVVAMLPAALGGGKAELLVDISKKKGGPANQQNPEIAFRPGQIKLQAGESRSVTLMLSQILDADVTITLSADSAGKIEFPATVNIPAGTKSVQISVKGISSGTAKVTATLPADQGGDTAELEVEVTS